jgi:hypothetical protein
MSSDLPTVSYDEHGRMCYEPDGVVLTRFMSSNARVRIIRGPIRSGTSSASCMEIWRRACAQAPAVSGLRKGKRLTRWFVARNTYAQLTQSTLKTWLHWFPEAHFGRLLRSKPFVHEIRIGDIEADVVFIALDSPEDTAKLRSSEWTGGWFNEVEYIHRDIFNEAESRVGYYPPVMEGGPTWSGLIADMNAPTEDNWIVRLTGDVAPPAGTSDYDKSAYTWPEGWEYFKQPAGLVEEFGPDGKSVVGYRLNPAAENLKWIPRIDGRPLYLETIKGKPKRWIDSRIMNRITPPVGGTPVWPMFVEESHVALQRIVYRPDYPLWLGMDFGRQPAVVLAQYINSCWYIIDEVTGFDTSASTFAPKFIRYLRVNYPELDFKDIRAYGDPKGADRNQSDELTAYDVWRSNGIDVRPAPVKGNSIKTRLEVVEYVLQRAPNGNIGFLISPKCCILKMAMSGGYRFKKNDMEREEPEKNNYSHIADALQYLLLGGGEGRELVGRGRDFSPSPQKVYSARGSSRRRF